MPAARRTDQKVLLVAAVLAVVGAWLIGSGTGGERDDGATTAQVDQSAAVTAGPSTDEPKASPTGTEPPKAPQPSGAPTPPSGIAVTSPPTEPARTSSPDSTATPTTTSAAEREGEGEGERKDPHGIHEPPTQEEVDRAPAPEFDHDFRTDVPEDLAAEVLDVAWTWLVPTLRERGWTHLKLVEHGVLGTRGDDGDLMVARAVIGYSGVYALGHIGIGKIVTVWAKRQEDRSWQVTGFRDEEFGPH